MAAPGSQPANGPADASLDTTGTAEPAIGWRPRAFRYRASPETLLGASILSIQVGSALATTLFDQVGPAAVALLKAAFAAAALLPASRAWRGPSLRPHLPMLLAFGAVIAAMFASSYETLARLPLGICATVSFLGPLGLAVAHARRLAHVLWLALALGGVLLLTPELFISGAGSLIGLAWAALSALSWAGFVVLSGRVSKAIPGLRGLAVATLFGALMLAPYAAIEGGVGQVDPAAAGTILLIALTTTILPLALEFSALRRMTPRSYGVLVSTEPAVAAIVGATLLGQSLGLAEALGIGLVCAASLGMVVSDRRS